MKKVLLGLLYTLAGLLLFVALYFAAEAVLSRVPAQRDRGVSARSIDIYIMSNGVHTDLVFPAQSAFIDWNTFFPYERTLGRDSTKTWVAIGWGDKGFYLNTPEWKDLSLKTALIAGLGIGETALHVTYYQSLREDQYTYKVSVSEKQYQKLIEMVLASLERDDLGYPIYIETTAQYGNDDAFYEALGAYNLFYSCNTWTNNVLKSAGLPSAVWTVFDKGVLRHYKKRSPK